MLSKILHTQKKNMKRSFNKDSTRIIHALNTPAAENKTYFASRR